MGNIGSLSTTTGSDMLDIRCPIGECKVIKISDVAGFTAGTLKEISDCIVLPLETVTSGIGIAAYDVPRMMYAVIGGSSYVAGEKLSFNTTSDAFEIDISEVKITAVLLELPASQSIASTALIAFNGYGFEDNLTGSDALTAV